MSGAYDYSKGFGDRAAVSLADPELGGRIGKAVDHQTSARLRVMESLKDSESLRDVAAQIRAAVLSRLDDHLDRLAENWERRGGKVFFAAEAEEATAYVCDLARRIGATTAVKSKSMASEEIGLNRALQGIGVTPIETDLGEFIVQLAGDHPSHIVAPAIHRSKADVAALFSDLTGTRMPEDAPQLTRAARIWLREKFLSAEMGITGTNFGVSEAGALCIVTNEGNARMCSSMPRVHVAVMGMERVVGTWEELAVMLALLARSSTGQKMTQYTSLLFGPRRPSESDGPEESHLVILDNGRSNVLGTRFQAALHCIRCGACLNVCPVFRQVGGHAYDPVYSGPIGAVLNPIIKGVENAGELAHASTLCGACTEACPVRIPLHDLLLYLRQEYARDAAGPLEHLSYRAWSQAWASERRFALFSKLGEAMGRATRGRSLGRLYLPLAARWTRAGRSFPGFPRATYRRRRRG
jgi:L-lactate dehydrogenase complex protein LldF